MKKFQKTVLGKTYTFSIKAILEDGEKLFNLVCKELNMNDVFDAEDLGIFLASDDFDFFIADEIRRQTKIVNRRVQITVSAEEQAFLERQAIKNNCKNVSEFARTKLFAST